MAKTGKATQSKSGGSQGMGPSKAPGSSQPKSGIATPGQNYAKSFQSRPGKDEKKPADKPATSANPAPIPPAGVVATPVPILPRAPDNPASMNNPNLPADRVQADRGQRRSLGAQIRDPQGTAQRGAQSYRGQNMSAVYTNYDDILTGRLPVTQQQYNGPRGQKTVLGK